MNYSLIIPIYNEGHTLQLLLNKLDKLKNNNIEIIIVDDGSNDNTQDILNENGLFIILNNKINSGKGASIKKGIKSANNQNIILIDGDLEIDIDQIPRLIKKYEKSDKDALVGIRWNKNSNIKLEINALGNFFINSLFNVLYRSNLNDVLCCVKILNTNLLKSLDIQSNGFSIEIETTAKLLLNNLTIEEATINYTRRSFDQGKKLKISDGWIVTWTMIKLKLFK
jgi:glycosyltransferase involved in cell wall biosynthesis